MITLILSCGFCLDFAIGEALCQELSALVYHCGVTNLQNSKHFVIYQIVKNQRCPLYYWFHYFNCWKIGMPSLPNMLSVNVRKRKQTIYIPLDICLAHGLKLCDPTFITSSLFDKLQNVCKFSIWCCPQ